MGVVQALRFSPIAPRSPSASSSRVFGVGDGGCSRRAKPPERRARVRQRAEERLIEKLVPQPAIEALGEGVLLRLARLNVLPADAVRIIYCTRLRPRSD